MDLTPPDPATVLEAVQDARTSSRRLAVVGGGTLPLLQQPGTATLRTTGLDTILRYEPADLTVTCQAGVTLMQLQQELAGAGQLLPVWHPAPDRATVGGLAAFGWAGLGRRLYGRLRDRLLEVHAVTGEGKAVRGGGKVVKNVTGFDLPRLYCGSLGSLGVITELTLKVHPRPGPLEGIRLDGGDRTALAARLRDGCEAARLPLEAVLVWDETGAEGMVFAPGPGSDAAELLARFGPAAALPGADAAFERLGRHGLLLGESGTYAVRASVPPSELPGLVGSLGPAPSGLADAGSGVVWAALETAAAVAESRRFAEERGGSLLLFRGPEGASLPRWGAPPGGIEIMRRLKHQFDPDAILPALPADL